LLAGCALPAAFCPQTSEPKAATSSQTAEATEIGSLETPLPKTVPVTLLTAPDSPSTVYYEIRNAAGDTIITTYKDVTVIYLLPGEYTYNAMTPIPTEPNWCYMVAAEYPYYEQGSFTVGDQPVVVQLKMGLLLLHCTETPKP